MGLLDFLSPALTTATQATGAYQNAEANAQQMERNTSLQALMMARQAHQQQIQDALAQSRTNYYNTRADVLGSPKPTNSYELVPGSDANGNPAFVRLNKSTGDTDVPSGIGLKPPAPAKQPTPHFSVTPITAADGTIHLARVNTLTGEVTDTGQLGKQPTPASGSALGAITTARLGVAQQQAQSADQIMTQFENGVLSGKSGPIPTAGIILAKKALEPGAFGSGTAETLLNTQYPDLAQYVRAAKTVATAERLISPRGGSNAMMTAEAMLSGAGAHANAAQIQQAQGYRRALIQGLSSHGAGTSPGASPAAGGPSSTSPKQPITAHEAAQLLQRGHTPEDIQQHYTVTGGNDE